jgi:hypothetical protein
MAADVGAWEPAAQLGEAHAEVLDRLAEALRGDALAVGDADARRLREVVHAPPPELESLLASCSSTRLAGWIKVLTLADEAVPGCEAGAQSPVIRMARLLRSRGDFPEDLSPWIKSVSSNRFLPYGSLMDRLKA